MSTLPRTAPGASKPGPHVCSSPQDLLIDNVYFDLSKDLKLPVVVKCEGLNLAGSVKLKAARGMLNYALAHGELEPGGSFIESSSGSLGVALAMLAANLNLRFTCVTDSRCNSVTLGSLRAYGAEVVVITEPHPRDGLLGARLQYVAERLATDPDMVWLNQYANRHNPDAHHDLTGPQIAHDWPDAPFIFIGAGTTGTLTGAASYLKEIGHPGRIIAVDSVGSVTFGQPAARRLIPGLGTGRRPQIADSSVFDELIMVPEACTVRICRKLARSGYLFGGSTGTVLAAAEMRLGGGTASGLSVALSPDFGERYIDTIYSDNWVAENFELETTRERPYAALPLDTDSAEPLAGQA